MKANDGLTTRLSLTLALAAVAGCAVSDLQAPSMCDGSSRAQTNAHLQATADSGRIYVTVSSLSLGGGCVQWRPVERNDWRSIEVPHGQSRVVIQGLSPTTRYAVRYSSWGATTAPVKVVPTPARSCFSDGYYGNPRLLVICSDADVVRALSLWPHWKGSQCALHGFTLDVTSGVHACRWALPERDVILYRASADSESVGTLVPGALVRGIGQGLLWKDEPRVSCNSKRQSAVAAIMPSCLAVVERNDTLLIQARLGLSSRVLRLPAEAHSRGIVIWLEGHGGDGSVIAASEMWWFAERGFQVFSMDMLLVGRNSVDRRPGLSSHDELMARASASGDGVAILLEPIKSLIDFVAIRYPDDPVILVGRSGGGWAASMYGALDVRVDYVVSIAGGVPNALRIASLDRNFGDGEQYDPALYSTVEHEVFAAAAGRVGALHVWSEDDECCFRLAPASPYRLALEAHGTATGRRVRTIVQRGDTHHGITQASLSELERELNALFPGPNVLRNMFRRVWER